jgi:SCO1/SenC
MFVIDRTIDAYGSENERVVVRIDPRPPPDLGCDYWNAILAILAAHRAPRVSSKPADGRPFQLTADTGLSVSSEELTGKPFVVFFGFTYCPQVCPRTS